MGGEGEGGPKLETGLGGMMRASGPVVGSLSSPAGGELPVFSLEATWEVCSAGPKVTLFTFVA